MRFVITIALAASLLAACEDDPQDRPFRYCPSGMDNSARAAWIIACATAANPKSDEEGEDLVIQCARTAEDLFCPMVLHHYNGTRWVPLDEKVSP